MQAMSVSSCQMMKRGALFGLVLAVIATGPSLVSAGFDVVQILMAVPLTIAFMALGAATATLFLLD